MLSLSEGFCGISRGTTAPIGCPQAVENGVGLLARLILAWATPPLRGGANATSTQTHTDILEWQRAMKTMKEHKRTLASRWPSQPDVTAVGAGLHQKKQALLLERKPGSAKELNPVPAKAKPKKAESGRSRSSSVSSEATTPKMEVACLGRQLVPLAEGGVSPSKSNPYLTRAPLIPRKPKRNKGHDLQLAQREEEAEVRGEFELSLQASGEEGEELDRFFAGVEELKQRMAKVKATTRRLREIHQQCFDRAVPPEETEQMREAFSRLVGKNESLLEGMRQRTMELKGVELVSDSFRKLKHNILNGTNMKAAKLLLDYKAVLKEHNQQLKEDTWRQLKEQRLDEHGDVLQEDEDDASLRSEAFDPQTEQVQDFMQKFVFR